MSACNENIGSWAVETDDYNNSNRGEYEDDAYNSSNRKDYRLQSDQSSPLKSAFDPHHRGHGHRQDDNCASGPNYRREKDGLSPLRSPLTSEQRTSRVTYSNRRRFGRDDEKNRKENNLLKSSSPNKKNRYSDTSPPQPKPDLSMDSEEQRFRRRLDLPVEKESSDNEDLGLLDPEDEEDKITLARREKQILYGKSTDSYKMYIATVPEDDRSVDRKKHPRTPTKWLRCSRRNWDAQIKAWKKHIHNWANINFPSMPRKIKLPKSESVSDSSSQSKVEEKEEVEQDEEEDNSLDLNEEEEDESFLEGFELDCN